VSDQRSLVSLKNAGIYRNSKWLVRGVDLSIAAGEIVTLIGPNGAGHSDLHVGYVPQKIEIDWTLPLSVERFMSITASLSKSELLANPIFLCLMSQFKGSILQAKFHFMN